MPHFMVSQVTRYAVKAKDTNEALMKVNVDGAGVVVDEHYTDVELINPDMVEIYMGSGERYMTSKPTTVGDLIVALHAFDIDMRVVIGDINGDHAFDLCHIDEDESVVEVDGEKAVIICPDYQNPRDL